MRFSISFYTPYDYQQNNFYIIKFIFQKENIDKSYVFQNRKGCYKNNILFNLYM